ncbi:hypothetical protein [Bradyrhizobium cenepequi]|nr:hypothetical protein [Bradyrhizobium cenepequi]MCA6107206.1 hypothetical protein [Bradyrhizobium cenepequi]
MTQAACNSKRTFECAGEGEEKPDMSAGRKYIAGASFFDKATYPKLA